MKTYTLTITCLALAFALGCSQDPSAPATSAAPAIAVDGDKYRLSEEPSDAKDVIQARESTEDGDDVVVVGRIGGSKDPWIADRAAFSIVDGSLKACSDIPGDMCKIPWDYCCETGKLPTGTALVKVVDEKGDIVRADARPLLDVKELSTVVVQGKAQRDDAGNLTILASGVYVRTK